MRTPLSLIVLFFASLANAQVNPGAIVDPATPAINPLDPNGDGFVTSTGGTFSGPLDETQFEIPFIPIAQQGMERGGDNQDGSGCDVFDIISDASQNADAAYYYYSDPDGISNNGDELIVFRIRIARHSNGSTGYSVLFDTDYKFGFTGPEADPNAIVGNPGFEREITAFTSTGASGGVKTLNVDGVADGAVVVYNASIHTNYQVSYALNQDPSCSSRAPTFVDMYVPFSTLGISPDTQVRMAVAVNEDPETALGGGADDIGGVDGDIIPSDDDQFIAAILNYSPIAFVAPPNIAPVVTDAFLSIDENSPNTASVYTVSATDPNGDILEFAIVGGNTDVAFAIDASTGVISINNPTALDAETNPVFTLIVEVSDGKLYNNAIITITLNDLNESAPTAFDAVRSLDENTANGEIVHTMAATDPDQNHVLVHSITAGNTNAAFTINSASGQIMVNNFTALDFENTPSFKLTVRVSDGMYSDDAVITINLNDVNESPAAADASVSVNENIPNGTLVHTVSATDPDAGAAFNYALIAGNTGTAFTIDGTSGKITVNNASALDFETTALFVLTVRVSDGNLFDDATITVTLNNANDAPSVTSDVFLINENSPNGTAAGNVIASDPEGNTLTYSIIAGNTASAFNINSTTGQIAVNNASILDHELNPSFTLTVQVSDGAYLAMGSITINLNDISEEPPVVLDAVVSLDEHAVNGTVAYAVSATDPDVAAVLTYAFTGGNTAGAFAINTTSGEITVANAGVVDFEATPVFALDVRVSDGTYFADATITINLNDINDPPTVDDGVVSINENTPDGTVVFTVSSADPDAASVLSYSILAGNTGAAFALNSSTGSISVNNAAALDAETVAAFVLTVSADDGTLSDQATITINVNDLNDQSPLVPDAVVSIDENTANSMTVLTVSGSDPDATSVLTYSITSGNSGTAFAINATTGIITVNNSAALDYESTPTYLLTLQASDGIFTDDGVITIHLNDINEQPPVASDAVIALDEYSVNGALVHAVSATDPDAAASLNYTIISGNTGNAFVIGTLSGEIRVNEETMLDFEINPVFNLTVRVSDGIYFDDAAVTISLNDTNDPPSGSDAAVAIDENSANGTPVHSLIATDANGDILDYAIISGNTGSAFTIDNSSGQITVNDAMGLDAETISVFVLTVRISDGSAFDDAIITVNLNDQNEQPTVAGDAVWSINENAGIGSVAGTVSATDPDIAAMLTYAIIGGNTGTAFTIDANTGELSVNTPAILDFETTSSFVLTVRVSDGTFNDDCTITINLIDANEAPSLTDVVIALSENSANNTTVHTVNGSDPDAGAVLAYSIISGNIDAAFTINGNTGEITVSNSSALDYESASAFVLTVRVDDGAYADDADVTINLTDVNEKPALSDLILYLDENTVGGFPVDTAKGTDPDAAAVLSYSIAGGNTNMAFAINSSTGVIAVSNAAAIDFETDPVFLLTVRVSDGILSHDAVFTVNIKDLSEAPSGADAVALPLDEHSANGTAVHIVSGADPDDGTILSYSIFAGNTGSAFDIDNNTGAIIVNDPGALDFETTPSFALIVRVSDGGLFDDAVITINLNDVNESPSSADATVAINENSITNTLVYNVAGADPDAGAALTYSIVAGNTGSAFSVNGTSGAIIVNNSGALDFETTAPFVLTVRVSDGILSDDAMISINVNDVNESPTAADAVVSLDELSTDGTPVHTVTGSDPDAGSVLSYSLTAGNAGTVFAIDASTGLISVANAAALDFESIATYFLTVRISDGSLFDDVSVTVNLNDNNEAHAALDATVWLNEHPPAGTVVHAVEVSDPDSNASLSYTIIAGDPGDAFVINSTTGEITVCDATLVDFESTTSFALTVRISDGSLSDDASIIINLNDVNEAPSCSAATISLNEHPANATLVHTVSATDPDAADVLIYSIVAGNTGNAFAINNTTGEISVTDSTMLDFETSTILTLTIRVSDGDLFTDGDIRVVLNNENESPVVQGASIVVEGRFTDNDVVCTVVATDPDAGDVLSFAITGGNTNNIFAIAPDDGQISIADADLLRVDAQSFELEISATDPAGKYGTGIVSVSIRQIPDEIVIVPQKGFSPNGDGINDFWFIDGIEMYPDNHIQVFNRWGTSVYETHGYDNASNAWRGETIGGSHGVESTYFFVITARGTQPVSGYLIVKP